MEISHGIRVDHIRDDLEWSKQGLCNSEEDLKHREPDMCKPSKGMGIAELEVRFPVQGGDSEENRFVLVATTDSKVARKGFRWADQRFVEQI